MYVATKPIRLDKDYAVGDTIPDDALDKAMIPRFIGWGKIAQVPDPKPAKGRKAKADPEGGAEPLEDGDPQAVQNDGEGSVEPPEGGAEPAVEAQ
jgi:hypothetical protein